MREMPNTYEIRNALTELGPDRVRRGLELAYPRIPIDSRAQDHKCDCFVGYAFSTEGQTTKAAFIRALQTFGGPAVALSYLYESESERLYDLASDWLAQQDAIEEVIQPALEPVLVLR